MSAQPFEDVNSCITAKRFQFATGSHIFTLTAAGTLEQASSGFVLPTNHMLVNSMPEPTSLNRDQGPTVAGAVQWFAVKWGDVWSAVPWGVS